MHAQSQVKYIFIIYIFSVVTEYKMQNKQYIIILYCVFELQKHIGTS